MGGIASGKSAVARALADPHGVHIDADALASEVLFSPELAPRLVETFGEEVLDRDGRPRREYLAQAVFNNPALRESLEDWIHPAVRARILAGLNEAQEEGAQPIVLDVPLLLENEHEHGLVDRCQVLVFVDSHASVRDQRARQQRGWQAGEVARREAAQLPLSQKRDRAHHVLVNDGSPEQLEQAITHLRAELGLP